MPLNSEQPWSLQDRFLELRSRWMTLIGEHLIDHQGKRLEYWRIEKADSVIVLPIQNNMMLLPAPTYRPGIGQATLDFPGGRIPEGSSAKEGAIATLQRELGIDAADLLQLYPLNSEGWRVNSSFSNQKLYSFVAHIQSTKSLSELIAATYPATPTGVQQLLGQLTCLQCRAVLLEWWHKSHS